MFFSLVHCILRTFLKTEYLKWVANPIFEFNSDIALACPSVCANLVCIVSWRNYYKLKEVEKQKWMDIEDNQFSF